MTSAAVPRISNHLARRLFLEKHGLASVPKGSGKGDDLFEVIDKISFVQLDSINTVARAHHMILAARRPAYKENNLRLLMERDRRLFEHWTHDASVIPIHHFGHWRMRFKRDKEALVARWRNWHKNGFEGKIDSVLKQINDHGPVTSSSVGDGEKRSKGGWWNWHPSKAALEFLWRSGEVSVSGRQNFQKVYDLTERVIPDRYRLQNHDLHETIDWAARAPLERLGFATAGEISAFWDLISVQEAKTWCQNGLRDGTLVEAEIECVDNVWRRVFVFPETLEALETLSEPPSRVRILSPFDPMIRDRKRAERLFGFSYRIEVFVPEAKRRYGYYVFPVLEKERLIGRIDMKALRSEDRLHIRAFWAEPGIRLSKGRLSKLEAELVRMAKFAGCVDVSYEADWLRVA